MTRLTELGVSQVRLALGDVRTKLGAADRAVLYNGSTTQLEDALNALQAAAYEARSAWARAEKEDG
jgi:hypothetical protein